MTTVIEALRTLSSRDEKVAAVAVIAAMCGALATLPVPPVLRVVPLLVFLLIGPGCAVMCWVELPPAVTIAAVVGISIASVMALSVVMAWLQFWHPVPCSLVFSAIVAGSGLMRLRALRTPVAAASGRPW